MEYEKWNHFTNGLDDFRSTKSKKVPKESSDASRARSASRLEFSDDGEKALPTKFLADSLAD